jgi:hypothetical protein
MLKGVANRILGTLVAVFIALLGTFFTALWGASGVYSRVEFHSQRLDKVEKSLDSLPKIQHSLDSLPKIQHSLDRLEKTIESQKPVPKS